MTTEISGTVAQTPDQEKRKVLTRMYDDKDPRGFVTWDTEYTGAFGDPWVAWLAAREAEGWQFSAAKVVGRGKKEKAKVQFRRPYGTESK